MTKARQKRRAVARRAAGTQSFDWRRVISSYPHIRKRIERGMPGEMMLAVAHFIHTHPRGLDGEKQFCAAILPDLEVAAGEAFNGLPQQRAMDACKAMAMACDYAWGVGEPSDVPLTPPVLMIATMTWLDHVEACGYLVPAEGSAFDRARQVIRGELDAGKRSERFAADYDAAKAAAMPLVARMQVRFEELGMFVGALDYLLNNEPAQVAA